MSLAKQDDEYQKLMKRDLSQSLNDNLSETRDATNLDQVPSQDSDEIEGQFNEALEASEKKLKVYPSRYIMAVLYSFMGLAISLQQSMYSAQGAQLEELYHVNAFMITANQLIHMLLHFPLSFPANYIVDKFGIKAGVIIAGFLLLAGSWVRCLINMGGNSFWISIVGAICVGTANPFIINSLNKVSANWFYPSDRPAVTSFLSFFSTVTGLIGIILPGFWFGTYTCKPGNCDYEKGKQLMFTLSITLASCVSVLVIPSMIFFKEKPPTPPSFVDSEEREDFKVALKVLAKDKNYILQTLAFAIFYGSFQDIASFLAFILEPFDLGKGIYTSILSGIPVISGIIGCIVCSKYLSKTQKYRKSILICELGSAISLLIFIPLLPFENFYILLPPAFLLGFCIIPLIPTLTEWACEAQYPIGEPTVTGFMWAVAHIYAGASGFGYTAMLNTKKKSLVVASLCIMLGLFILGFVGSIFIKVQLKRLQAEKQKAQEAETQESVRSDEKEQHF